MIWAMAGMDPAAFWAAMAVTLFAGFVKGAVGFAMPLIMISAFSGFLTPHQALAGLILPTLVTNLSQAFRQGIMPAMQSAKDYRLFLRAMIVCIALSGFGMSLLPTEVLFLALGVPITAYAAWQLAGRSLTFRVEHRPAAELTLGAIGGLYGGFSGVWGPPMLVFLLSQILLKSRSQVAIWYSASIGVALFASLYEVISASMGFKGLIGAVNSVTAALSSSLRHFSCKCPPRFAGERPCPPRSNCFTSATCILAQRIALRWIGLPARSRAIGLTG